MSDRRPMPSDPGDDDVTPPRGTPITRDRGEWDDQEWDEEDWDEPNYLVRRALVVAAVVIGIAVVAWIIGRLLSGSDNPTTSSSQAAEWNTLVVLTADEIQVLDGSSTNEIAVYPAPDDLLDAQSVIAGNILVTMTDEGRLTQVDLNDGSMRRGRSGLDETLRISSGNPAIAVSGSDSGGDVTIIDTRERSVLSVADVADLSDPLIFANDVLVNIAGTHVAVPVPNAFQSVVIDLTTETSIALAGRVIALDDERVVTEQPAGERSELEFYDLLGERLGSVDVTGPHASMLRADGSMLIVSTDGIVSTVTSNGEVDDTATIVDPADQPIEITGGTTVADGTRLVAIGADRVFVLDADGTQLGAFTGSILAPVQRGTRCVVVGSGSSATPSSLIQLDTGAIAGEIDRGVIATSSYDGCTNAVLGSPAPRVLASDRTIDVDANSIAAVSPDGRAVIAVAARQLQLVELGSEAGADNKVVADIGDSQAVVRFGRR